MPFLNYSGLLLVSRDINPIWIILGKCGQWSTEHNWKVDGVNLRKSCRSGVMGTGLCSAGASGSSRASSFRVSVTWHEWPCSLRSQIQNSGPSLGLLLIWGPVTLSQGGQVCKETQLAEGGQEVPFRRCLPEPEDRRVPGRQNPSFLLQTWESTGRKMIK